MKIVRIKQNTEEWLEYRLGKIKGSSLGKLYSRTAPTKDKVVAALTQRGETFKKTDSAANLYAMLDGHEKGILKSQMPKKDEFYRLVAEMIARPKAPMENAVDDKPETDMSRGHRLEPEALAEFEKNSGKKLIRDPEDPTKYDNPIWQSDEHEKIMLSPDGQVEGLKEAVEVKCPESHKVIRAYDEGHYPDEYHEQVLQYFIVNPELELLNFVIYTDLLPALPYQCFEIKREDVEDSLEEYIEFEKQMLIQAESLIERLAF